MKQLHSDHRKHAREGQKPIKRLPSASIQYQLHPWLSQGPDGCSQLARCQKTKKQTTRLGSKQEYKKPGIQRQEGQLPSTPMDQLGPRWAQLGARDLNRVIESQNGIWNRKNSIQGYQVHLDYTNYARGIVGTQKCRLGHLGVHFIISKQLTEYVLVPKAPKYVLIVPSALQGQRATKMHEQ